MTGHAYVDTNVYLSRWPFRRLPRDEAPELVSALRRAGVTRAWAGSFDALLHKDLAAVNARLAADCRTHGRGLLLPFGTVNPTAPDWKEDLRRCREVHRMPGLRLHPGYHGYKLDDPHLLELASLAAGAGMVVQVAVRIDDERTQHPLVRVPPVDLAPVAALVRQVPALRLQLLAAFPQVRERLPELVAAGRVYMDIATLEGAAGIARLLETVPKDRVLFGSMAPFFTFESAALKLVESDLPPATAAAVAAANATALAS
jgi:predicted TIM-barrel fold metal-dependent hydrolase